MEKTYRPLLKLAYFPGCKISFYMHDYGLSFEAVMFKLGVELVKLPFNCCGYPARGDGFEISIFSAIKNLAIAEKYGLDMITPCKCCYGQFKHAMHWYKSNRELRDAVNSLLKDENLSWDDTIDVKHMLPFLHKDYGLNELQSRIACRVSQKKTVVQYGCHALRPFAITGFDHPYAPTVFEDLIGLTGIECVEWSKRTECCGNPVLEHDPELSFKILNGKFESAARVGADYICTACTHCQIQYETGLDRDGVQTNGVIPLLFTQALGLALGIEHSQLSSSDSLPAGLVRAFGAPS